jgi:exoribonuclease R
LVDYGISGFVEARTITEKLSFDADTLRLHSAHSNYQLEQIVNVKVSELDDFQRKLMFILA